tara:strand:- start:1353 stop:1646 length:294 start_codon:yes stop_codon:yes gene_type:complete
MKIGDIVTVVTPAGEFVGELTNDEPVILKNPRLMVSGAEGKIGFAKGIAASGTVDPTDVMFNNYIFLTDTAETIQNGWKTHTGETKIQVPDEKTIIT